jgi:Tetracyclin repressor-like, C-terminal domain
MRHAIDAFLSFVESHPLAWQMLSREGAGDNEIVATDERLRARNMWAVRELLAGDMLAAGIDPKSERAELLVEIAASAVEGIARWAHEHPGVPRPRLVDAAMELLWDGLGSLLGAGR